MDVYNAVSGEGDYRMSKEKELETPKPEKSIGSSPDSLNTELRPVAPQKEQTSPCVLCAWLERRLNNTSKELVKHMEAYHIG